MWIKIFISEIKLYQRLDIHKILFYDNNGFLSFLL